MGRRVGAFLAFWYRFVVGEDGSLTLGVIAALLATYGLTRAGLPAWWVLPVVVAFLLSLSVWRAARRRA